MKRKPSIYSLVSWKKLVCTKLENTKMWGHYLDRNKEAVSYHLVQTKVKAPLQLGSVLTSEEDHDLWDIFSKHREVSAKVTSVKSLREATSRQTIQDVAAFSKKLFHQALSTFLFILSRKWRYVSDNIWQLHVTCHLITWTLQNKTDFSGNFSCLT